jgi:hypothetical protein
VRYINHGQQVEEKRRAERRQDLEKIYSKEKKNELFIMLFFFLQAHRTVNAAVPDLLQR